MYLQIVCKYATNCQETGIRINKGDICLYNTVSKQLFCQYSNMYKNYLKSLIQ